VLFLVKRGKTRRLEEIKKREEEEAKERIRLMEEEWKRQEEAENNKQPEFVLLSSGNNQSPFLAITEVDGAKAEDGELADLFGEA